MAQIEHSVRTASATVWQRFRNDGETRTSDRHVREVLPQVFGSQTVWFLHDERTNTVCPRPGADSHGTGQGLLVFHRPRSGLGPVHVRAGQSSVFLKRPEMEDNAPKTDPGLHVGKVKGHLLPNQRVQ